MDFEVDLFLEEEYLEGERGGLSEVEVLPEEQRDSSEWEWLMPAMIRLATLENISERDKQIYRAPGLLNMFRCLAALDNLCQTFKVQTEYGTALKI